MITAERRKAFPERIAVVYPDRTKGCPIKFSHEEMISNKVALLDGKEQPVVALRHTTVSNVCDAILIIRPYVRILDGEGPVSGKLTFRIDREVVLDRIPLEGYLVEDMKDPMLDTPIEVPKDVPLFGSGTLTQENVVLSKQNYGIFAPHKSYLEVDLDDALCPKGPVLLEVGCIAATYTTKGFDVPHKR
jgi:hypothetical protein